MKMYEYHELSNIFPLMEGEEFDALVEDIRDNGLYEPIILYENKILDGRNRDRACKMAKVEAKYKELPKGVEPLEYIISQNLRRRHLNIAQRAEIGLILLEEEEKKKTIGRPRKKDPEFGIISDDIKKGKSTKIVAPKVKIAHSTLSDAKKIKEIAKKDPMIAEEWEKAKKGEVGIHTVFEKAQIIEEIAPLPKSQQEEIKKVMDLGDLSTKQIREEIREKKDNLKRIDLAKKSRTVQKQKAEMDKLRLQIREIENKMEEYKNALKTTEANLIILAQESVEKYPDFKLNTPDYIITHLGIYYDSLDMNKFDVELKSLRNDYDELEKPLRLQLEKLENEFKSKKEIIDSEKANKNKEVVWIEKQQDLMNKEFDKQSLYKKSIEEYQEKLGGLEEKHNEFK